MVFQYSTKAAYLAEGVRSPRCGIEYLPGQSYFVDIGIYS